MNTSQQKPVVDSPAALPRPVLQRKCACGGTPLAGGECAECRKKNGGTLQRRARDAEPDEVPSVVHEALRSPGQALDASTRRSMERSFGRGFGNVRVHTGGKAGESARAVSAQAYTVGRDIVFGAGQFAPHTGEGRKLLAHELTHVVQQAGAASGPPTAISKSSDVQEQEAARVAQEVTESPEGASRDQQAEMSKDSGTAATIQRQAEETEDTAPAGPEEGVEINPDELMVMPRLNLVEFPAETAEGAGGSSPVLQRQKAPADHCDNIQAMRAVTSGTFEGGKTMDDYFPDLVGKNFWGTNNKAGTFDNGSRAGSSVQLVGDLPIPCETSTSPTILAQSATIVRARADGRKMMENGKALEGQTFDDIKRSRRDQSKAPFRQTWTGSVSMADPISGIPYAALKSYEWEVNLTTSLTGAGGSASVSWGVTVEAAAGKVTKNEVR